MNDSPQSRSGPTRLLAREWWRNRAIFNGGPGELTVERVDVDIFAEQFAESSETFGEMIVALVAEAPDVDSLDYVGTVFLEDGYLAMGPEALELFDALDIPAQAKERILSGFQLPGNPAASGTSKFAGPLDAVDIDK